MWKKIIIVLLVVFVLIIGAKDYIIKWAVEAGASQALGVDVNMSGFHLSFLKQSLELNGLKVYNPKGFPAQPMIVVSDIKVSANLQDLKKKRIHLNEVSLLVDEISVVRNEAGVLNIESIKSQPKDDKTKKEPVDSAAKPEKKKQDFTFLIDELNVAAPKVIFTDLSAKDKSPQVLNIDVKRKYNNIDSPQRLAWLIVADVTKAAGVKSAAAYGAKALKEAGLASPEAQGLIGVVTDSLFSGK